MTALDAALAATLWAALVVAQAGAAGDGVARLRDA
jgi:hypothetical protein